MPGSLSKAGMSVQDSDTSLTGETPDRSLGSISLNLNATGEELDDIQMTMDRLYLESPAPSSHSLLGSGSEGAVGGGRSTPLGRVEGVTRIFGGRMPRVENVAPAPDQEGFDRLSLLEVEELSDVINDDTAWLCDAPPRSAGDFNEEDRSFLDTGLLNIRYSLLNYVTRAINEQKITTNGQISSSSSQSDMPSRQSSRPNLDDLESPPYPESSEENLKRSPEVEGAAALPRDNDNDRRRFPDRFLDRLPISPIRHVPEPRRVMQNEEFEEDIINHVPHVNSVPRDVAPNLNYGGRGRAGGAGSREFNSAMDAGAMSREMESGDQFNVSSRELESQLTAALLARGAGSREIDSRTYTRPKKSRFTLPSRSPMNKTMDMEEYDLGAGGDAAVSMAGRNLLDTTRDLPPPRNGAYGSSPQRFLNTTMSLSPERGSPRHGNAGSSHRLNDTFSGDSSSSGRSPLQQLNRTIDISPDRMNDPPPRRGSPLRQLNTTMDMTSPERRSSLGASGISSPPANLNETFTAENGESASEKSRRVTRNLSYVIRRDEESPNNNSSSPHASANTSRCDLNNTFSYEQDTERDSQVTRSSQNTSMEDLNSRVASQIRSLGCSTITRGRYSEQGGRAIPNLDDARLVARTSSTDTYSVAHSSESPTSSGLSSPMDAQSYDDIQSSSEAVRRSMPNLAVIRSAATMRSNLAFPHAGAGQLRKNHYISDSRLSRLGNGDTRPRLRVHGSESTSSASSFNQGLNTSDGSRSRTAANTSTPAALNRISGGISSGTGAQARVYSANTLGSTNNSRASTAMNRPQGSSLGNVRSTGMPGPRYTGGLRPPRPISTSNVQQVAPSSRSSSAPGIPVPIRAQSRIPAPGQFRFSRPTPSASNRLMGNSKAPSSSHPKGPIDDWRDGCY